MPLPAANPVTVSVVVSTYNRSQYLAEALASILDQTRPPDEVIVVDDGSTDATPDILRSFGARIHCIRIPNGGKAAALNMAIPQAAGSHIWIFDDDDVALPDSLARQLAFLAAHPQVDFTYSSKYRTGGDAIWQRDAWALEQAPAVVAERLFIELLHGMFMTMQGMLIPKQCLLEAGLFDAALIRAQDYDLVIRLAARCRGGLVDAPTFVYRMHPGPRGAGAQWRTRRQQEAKVLEYTQAVLRKARDTWPLGTYLSPRTAAVDAVLTAGDRGQALLQRACVMLRKGLVDEARADLAAALAASHEAGCVPQAWRREVALAVGADPLAFRHPYRLAGELGPTLARAGGRGMLPGLAQGAWWALRRSLRRHAWPELRVSAGMLARAMLRYPGAACEAILSRDGRAASAAPGAV